jgi:hypothetical protein
MAQMPSFHQMGTPKRGAHGEIERVAPLPASTEALSLK